MFVVHGGVAPAPRPHAPEIGCSKELKEHVSLHWSELFASGLHGQTHGSAARLTVKVPRSDVRECGSGVFLDVARCVCKG